MKITDKYVTIIGNLEKLETLNLSRTTITDNALKYIYGLKKLILQNCMNITDSGLRNLMLFSPKLELLDIRRCETISKDLIRKIVHYENNRRLNNVPLDVLM